MPYRPQQRVLPVVQSACGSGCASYSGTPSAFSVLLQGVDPVALIAVLYEVSPQPRCPAG